MDTRREWTNNLNYKELITKSQLRLDRLLTRLKLPCRLRSLILEDLHLLLTDIIMFCKNGIKPDSSLDKFSFIVDRVINDIVDYVLEYDSTIDLLMIFKAFLDVIEYMEEYCLKIEQYEFLHNINTILNNFEKRLANTYGK